MAVDHEAYFSDVHVELRSSRASVQVDLCLLGDIGELTWLEYVVTGVLKRNDFKDGTRLVTNLPFSV